MNTCSDANVSLIAVKLLGRCVDDRSSVRCRVQPDAPHQNPANRVSATKLSPEHEEVIGASGPAVARASGAGGRYVILADAASRRLENFANLTCLHTRTGHHRLSKDGWICLRRLHGCSTRACRATLPSTKFEQPARSRAQVPRKRTRRVSRLYVNDLYSGVRAPMSACSACRAALR
jgi:hypothetical protein